jgi:hypothetical protein
MPIIIDPETRQRIVTEKHTGDINYFASNATSSTAVTNETVPVIGDWSDYTGSGTISSAQQQQFAGITNQLQGTEADIEGHSKLPVLNEMGQRAQTSRRRLRLINRELTPEGKLKSY